MKPIKRRKKKAARELREGMGYMPNNGSVSTHLMSSVEADGRYFVYPTIYPVAPNEYVDQTFEEALERGEVFEFRTPQAADKFARGGWKPRSIRKDRTQGENYNMDRAVELGYNADETGHWPSVDYTNGMWLKSSAHPTAIKELLHGYLGSDHYKTHELTTNRRGYFGKDQLQYIPKR